MYNSPNNNSPILRRSNFNTSSQGQTTTINKPIAQNTGSSPKPEIAKGPIIPELIPLDPSKKVQVIPIGGLCEIGKNTWIIRCDDKMIIIDAGLAFPSEDMHGVDLVLPELTYLIENKDKILGMFITHGHEDHIGGVANMLKSVNIPIIYGPPLAIGLLEGKLKEHGLLQKTVFKRTKPRETIQIGSFALTFVRNNHSILSYSNASWLNCSFRRF